MIVVLGLLAFVLLLDIAALAGWAPSTRDGLDWRRSTADRPRRGPIHSPVGTTAASPAITLESASSRRHAGQAAGVVTADAESPSSSAPSGAHAAAA